MSADTITASEARRQVTSGDAWLVCAYDDPEKCEKVKLEGSISLDELKEKEPARSQTLIFY